jgi:hypothetical protein
VHGAAVGGGFFFGLASGVECVGRIPATLSVEGAALRDVVRIDFDPVDGRERETAAQ